MRTFGKILSGITADEMALSSISVIASTIILSLRYLLECSSKILRVLFLNMEFIIAPKVSSFLKVIGVFFGKSQIERLVLHLIPISRIFLAEIVVVPQTNITFDNQ